MYRVEFHVEGWLPVSDAGVVVELVLRKKEEVDLQPVKHKEAKVHTKGDTTPVDQGLFSLVSAFYLPKRSAGSVFSLRHLTTYDMPRRFWWLSEKRETLADETN